MSRFGLSRSPAPGAKPATFTFLKTHSYSVSFARHIFWNQVIEAAYVGTSGRNLGSFVDGNVVPQGALSSGIAGNADLSIPVNRLNLDSTVVNSLRPFQAYGPIVHNEFKATSQYHSLQVTLSRQTGKRLQYFVAYTLSRTQGTLRGFRDPFDSSRGYGVLNEDRTHLLNVSWNALLPAGARGRLDTPLARGVLNGWQLSGISTVASGIPIQLTFSGDVAGPGVVQAWFGTPDVVGPEGPGTFGANSLAPQFTCDPRLGGSAVGERILNVDCIKVPDFGKNPPLVPPYNIRTPWRMNHDLTLFKNFVVAASRSCSSAPVSSTCSTRPPRRRSSATTSTSRSRPPATAGWTMCPTASATTPTTCATRPAATPSRRTTIDNFGKINIKRGHRIVELVVKYYFQG